MENNENELWFTMGDIDAEQNEIIQTFNELKKYNEYVGAKTPNELYLAGGTAWDNDDKFIPNSNPEVFNNLMLYPAMGGAEVQMGTFNGKLA